MLLNISKPSDIWIFNKIVLFFQSFLRANTESIHQWLFYAKEMLNLLKSKNISKIIVSAAVILSAWIWWGNKSIQITEYEVEYKNLSQELAGFTIVHISDLHNAKFGNNQSSLISKITACDPDIIAITGDLIDSRKTDINTAMLFINEAVKIAPVYYVPGNHEARVLDEYNELKQYMEDAGVHIMEDSDDYIEYSGEKIHIVGVTDPSFSTGVMDDIESIMETVLSELVSDDSIFTVLLSHRPELMNIYSEYEIDLALTGHAHGGQFRIPFIGGLIAPNQGLFPKYTEGVHSEGDTKMIVSRGLGNSLFPFRINNRPEIVVVRIAE